jgi:hypothetical protein
MKSVRPLLSLPMCLVRRRTHTVLRGACADASFAPLLEQIDQVDASLAVLEQATREMDEYSKRLEAKFKKVLAK